MYRFATALCVSFLLAALPASCAAIGVVVASGSFRVDNNLVAGNATLFDGNTLENVGASSDVEISGGARVRLGADSRGKVFRDRLVLEKGLSELNGGSGFWIEARGLRILPGGPGATGRVAVSGLYDAYRKSRGRGAGQTEFDELLADLECDWYVSLDPQTNEYYFMVDVMRDWWRRWYGSARRGAGVPEAR